MVPLPFSKTASAPAYQTKILYAYFIPLSAVFFAYCILDLITKIFREE
jgi:hypothetical protein